MVRISQDEVLIHRRKMSGKVQLVNQSAVINLSVIFGPNQLTGSQAICMGKGIGQGK
jgi:hypothetical protein